MCIVESPRFHRPNLVSCEIVAGDQLIPLIKAYLPPSTLDLLPYLEEVLNKFLGRDSVILGDLNVEIGCLRNPQDQQATDFFASFGVEDLLDNF